MPILQILFVENKKICILSTKYRIFWRMNLFRIPTFSDNFVENFLQECAIFVFTCNIVFAVSASILYFWSVHTRFIEEKTFSVAMFEPGSDKINSTNFFKFVQGINRLVLKTMKIFIPFFHCSCPIFSFQFWFLRNSDESNFIKQLTIIDEKLLHFFLKIRNCLLNSYSVWNHFNNKHWQCFKSSNQAFQ